MGTNRERLRLKQALLRRKRAERRELHDELNPLKARLTKLTEEIDQLEQEVTSKDIGPHISDHAVLRYLERVCRLDIESVRNRMMTPAVRMAVQQGAGKVKGPGYVLILEKNVIVTTVANTPSKPLNIPDPTVALDILFKQVECLVNESDGVIGWHKNGEVAAWDEVLDLSEVKAAMATADEVRALKDESDDVF